MATTTTTTETTTETSAAAPAGATAEPAATADPTTTAAPPAGGMLQRILTEGKLARDESQVPLARDLIGEFVQQLLEPSMTVNPDTITMLNHRIAQIDELISEQLNQVLHAEPFQKLEASWRGLHYLVMNSETGTHLKLRVMHATKKELLNDLEKATEFDQSALFKKVYEEEYGTFGGEPYGLLVGDYEFGRHPQDVALLEKISNVAAAAHAPFITAASPKLFDLDSFTELGTPRDLAKIFESSELIKWRGFRDSEDSRYVTLALPRVLMRLPYGPDTVPVDGFNFVEDVDGTDHGKYLWGNAAWALGQRITHAFALHRWCATIRGVENGGVVKGLPAHTFKTDEGEIAVKCPTEIAITDRREKELSDLGFLALCHCKGTDYAAFFGSQTVQRPRTYDTPQANANASLSAQLPYILTASRFAHYLKVIMRDKIGSFSTQASISSYLNRWIGNYVLLNESGGPEMMAQHPLNEARIDVTQVPGKVGAYRAVAFLRPHFQLTELTTSIRLVAELPAPAAA
jgi:type VI secretion system protein ImpC